LLFQSVIFDKFEVFFNFYKMPLFLQNRTGYKTCTLPWCTSNTYIILERA